MTAEGNTPNRFILSLPVCVFTGRDVWFMTSSALICTQACGWLAVTELAAMWRLSVRMSVLTLLSSFPRVIFHFSPSLPVSRLFCFHLPSSSLCALSSLSFLPHYFSFPPPPICLTPLSLVEWHIGVKKCCQLALQRSLTAWQSSSSSCEKSERMNKKTSMEKQDVEIIKELL